MPAWAWWGVIGVGLCALSWLHGRLSRPHAPAANGEWQTSWPVYFRTNGGAAHAILKSIRRAQETILVQAYLKARRHFPALRQCWSGRMERASGG
jgi:hypothetical protein